ncbi:MAG: LysE family translocator [Beijerinckiaceae bacterium]
MLLTGFAEVSHLWLFALLVFGIVVTPGMDMAFVLARALAGGSRAGFVAVAGLVIGGAVHTLMGLIGIGLVLQAAPGAFAVLLVLGSAYVAWIGWSLLRGASALGPVAEGPPMPMRSIFAQAALTCLMNPKAYLFMIAIFPQFLRPAQGSLPLQALTLGLIIAATQAAVYGAVALAAGGLAERLATSASAQRRLGRSVGVLLMATAAWALWTGLRGL